MLEDAANIDLLVFLISSNKNHHCFIAILFLYTITAIMICMHFVLYPAGFLDLSAKCIIYMLNPVISNNCLI